MQTNAFWIYPTYFEISQNEVSEVTVIFQPNAAGLHVETMYLICDNNSFTEFEIMGDALCLSHANLCLDVSNVILFYQIQMS